MSKLIITGIAGIVALGGLAVLPQISTAAATYVAPTEVSSQAGSSTQPAASVGVGSGSSYAPAFAANRQSGYRTCFMRKTVSFTAQGPKQVTTPTCAD